VNVPSSRTGRRAPWVIAALVIVPLVVLAGIYLLFFTDDSPEELTLSDPPVTQPGVTPVTGGSSGGFVSTLEGTWNVAQGSVAGYRVKEKLASLPAQSDAVGRTESITGTVRLRSNGSRLEAEAVNVEVDVSTLKSDEDRRDNRVRGALGTDQFPKATFTSTGGVVLPDNLAAGDDVTADIAGQLTIHGVTKQVTIPLQFRVTGGQGEVVGSLTFPFSDFEISPPNIGGFVSVESDATLEFKMLLTRA